MVPLCLRLSCALFLPCALLHAAPPPPVRVHWMAPWLSGGGYSSEALSFAVGAASLPGLSLSGAQHGDSVDAAYARGLPAPDAAALDDVLRAGARGAPVGAVCVCHSEPGAWHLPPALPRAYATAVCPPPAGCAARVARTMFETDRLPSGWLPRLLAMDAVWVPSRFTADVFASAGLPRGKLRLLGEAVDADFFSPEAAAAAAAADAAGRAK